MEPRATVIRASDGTERVLLDLADFQALLDAADAAAHGLPEIGPVVQRRMTLEPAEYVDLDDFLAEYNVGLARCWASSAQSPAHGGDQRGM
jgi:hypothetical protein